MAREYIDVLVMTYMKDSVSMMRAIARGFIDLLIGDWGDVYEGDFKHDKTNDKGIYVDMLKVTYTNETTRIAT